MNCIRKNLYQFSQYRREINISDHQYLLMCSRPMLIYTGTHAAAEAILPEIEKLLDGRELSCIFVSHTGADECGGLSVILERYPHAQVICSEHTARQLEGFGVPGEFCVTSPGMKYVGDDYELQFVEYPSDSHLLPGLLMYEAKSGVFFSSDLMMRAGDGAGKTTHSTWKDEVHATNVRQVPNMSMVHQLRKDLMKLSPDFVAVGHGYCMIMD